MRQKIFILAAALAVSVGLAGCEASSDGGTPGGTVEVDPALYESTFAAPPSDAPQPPSDISLWMVSCGENAVGCSTGSAAVVQAAEALGWAVDVCDGRLNEAGGWGECIRQGIVAGADAIAIGAVDCPAVRQPLIEARDAGIPVVSFWGYDCSQVPGGEGDDDFFTASVIPSAEHPTTADYQRALGAAQAQWIVESSGGDANALIVRFEGTALGTYWYEGFIEQYTRCGGCAAVDVPVSNQSLGDLRQTFESALLTNPEADYVASPLDSLILLGVGPAVVASGRSDSLQVIGGEGHSPNLDFVRGAQGQDAAVGQSIAWWGYAAVDTLNRVLAGEAPEPAGLGYQLVDARHNLPADGGYEPPVDFRGAYREAWGVQ